jgi:hypothetical protein
VGLKRLYWEGDGMTWIVRIIAKAKQIDMTDVMNQQFGEELLVLVKEWMM